MIAVARPGLVAAALALALLLPQPAAAQSCAALIRSNAYACTVKRDNGEQFDDCYDFTSPGRLSDKFDLSIAGAGFDLGCSCEAAGTFRQPRFDRSRRFHCVSSNPEARELQLAVEGLASNRRLAGTVVSDFGTSFVFKCRRTRSCASIVAQGLDDRGSPYD